MEVKVYLKTNATVRFPARDIRNARDIAAKITREGLWIVNDDGTEEYLPVTEVNKAKILPDGYKEPKES